MNLDKCNKCVYRILCKSMLLSPTLRCIVWGTECQKVADCHAFKEGGPLILRIERLERLI